MDTLYFEETKGHCQNESLSTSGTRCNLVGKLRRVMSKNYRVIGMAYCKKCMPDFFDNKNNHIVVKALSSSVNDPVFEDYVNFYRRHFIVYGKGLDNE